jgi:hypothetical protein
MKITIFYSTFIISDRGARGSGKRARKMEGDNDSGMVEAAACVCVAVFVFFYNVFINHKEIFVSRHSWRFSARARVEKEKKGK